MHGYGHYYRDVGKKIFMMVDLIKNIASELLTLLKIIEFLTGLTLILSYKKNLFFKTLLLTSLIYLGLS